MASPESGLQSIADQPTRQQLDELDALDVELDALDVDAYFTYLANLMKTNPPHPEDAPLVARIATIGLVPGQDYDPSKLGGSIARPSKPFPSWRC